MGFGNNTLLLRIRHGLHSRSCSNSSFGYGEVSLHLPKPAERNACTFLAAGNQRAAQSGGGDAPRPGLDASRRVQLGKVSWNRLKSVTPGVLGYSATQSCFPLGLMQTLCPSFRRACWK